jgi:acyl carrier protein
MPLDPNGKVDRRALLESGSKPHGIQAHFVAPRTELERFLASIWQETLQLGAIGVHDNFFEIGGDSMKSVVIISKLQARFGETIHPVVLFDAPSISELAATLIQAYAEAVIKNFGVESLMNWEGEGGTNSIQPIDAVDENTMSQMRALFATTPRTRRAAWA